ncbi:MAG: GDSL-type esterase/lipase family protein [Planctomycetota bacterium]
MRKFVVVAVLALAFVSSAFVVRAEEAAKKQPATITPAVKNPERHTGFLAVAKKGDIDLLFMGDSITDGWRGRGKKIWDANFASLKAANFGISGDRTQHVLWRIQNGELEGFKAKLVVLMIGTNNGGDSKEDVALGITTIVQETQKRQPDAKVLILGIFPRGKLADDKARAKNALVNEIVAKMDDGGKKIKYLDIGDKFLDDKKNLPADIMPDALHPNEKGYQIWADAILPTVKEMLGAK